MSSILQVKKPWMNTWRLSVLRLNIRTFSLYWNGRNEWVGGPAECGTVWDRYELYVLSAWGKAFFWKIKRHLDTREIFGMQPATLFGLN